MPTNYIYVFQPISTVTSDYVPNSFNWKGIMEMVSVFCEVRIEILSQISDLKKLNQEINTNRRDNKVYYSPYLNGIILWPEAEIQSISYNFYFGILNHK